MAKTTIYRGKRYKAWGFRFSKREANRLASSLRKEYNSVITREETNRMGHKIYVVYFRGRR